LLVSALDWHPVTNRIVTAGHDRNAFVWTYNGGKDAGEPTGSIPAIDRAALDVKWSPAGTKFAVASGNKNAVVCWYDPANNWWIGNPCKREKMKSTAHSSVTAVAWHPGGQVLAAASTDYRARVLFAYVEGVDAAPDGAQFGAGYEFGDVIAEFEQTRAWVNDIAWSPSGLRLGFLGHDGLIHIVSFDAAGKAPPATVSIKTSGLPAMKLLWLHDAAIVTAGHSMNPEVYTEAAADRWALAGACDEKPAAGGGGGGGAGGAAGPRASSSFGSAKAIFAAKVTRGVTAAEADDIVTALWTKHQGAITSLQPYTLAGALLCLPFWAWRCYCWYHPIHASPHPHHPTTPYPPNAATGVRAFSTTGADGRIVVWDLAALKHIRL